MQAARWRHGHGDADVIAISEEESEVKRVVDGFYSRRCEERGEERRTLHRRRRGEGRKMEKQMA